ncbi:7796_t:CDS:2, partial [Paraglomus brasilianum]
MKVEIVKAKVGLRKVNCRLEPGFLGISMCSDKLLKKIGGKISRKLTPEEKDSKFVREETQLHLDWLTCRKYDPKTPNYILLDLSRSGVAKTKKKSRVIVLVNKRDIHDFYKIFPGKSKESLPHRSNISATSDSVTSDSNSGNSSTSSSEIEVIHIHIHKAEADPIKSNIPPSVIEEKVYWLKDRILFFEQENVTLILLPYNCFSDSTGEGLHTQGRSSQWRRFSWCCKNQFHTPKEEALPTGFTKRRRVAHTRAFLQVETVLVGV